MNIGITVVTPSYNQAAFIEETLESVLRQECSLLQYIVIDGGSTDGSREIIQRFSHRLHYWVSEKDQGQPDALRKGFAKASGDILGWINSDDILCEGALARIGDAYGKNPRSIIAGDVAVLDENGRVQRIIRQRNLNVIDMVACWTGRATYCQPGVFFPREAYLAAGGIDVNLHYCMDRDLMIRMLRMCDVVYLGATVAGARLHPQSKTCSRAGAEISEAYEVSHRYWNQLRLGPISCRALSLGGLCRCALGRIYHRDFRALGQVSHEMGRILMAR